MGEKWFGVILFLLNVFMIIFNFKVNKSKKILFVLLELENYNEIEN